MTRPAAHIHREETAPGPAPMTVYMPLLWMAAWIIRAGLRLGIIPVRIPSSDIAPDLMHRNRQLRRARMSCLRRAARQLRKGRKIDKEKYTPRAYAHYAYVVMMPKHYTPGQFMESYLRDSYFSRAQHYGLDHAHEITGFLPEAIKGLCQTLAQLIASMGTSPLCLAAPADPAPP